MNQDQDYDNDGNNIVPCPICNNVYCPSKEEDKCPEEDDFVKAMEEKDKANCIYKNEDCPICPKEKIEIVVSPRIDHCGTCGKEHGYDCPLYEKVTKAEVIEIIKDWYTIAPKYRTKENLINKITKKL